MPKNNFDFLRLVFAFFVIITHSYRLSGLPEVDWIYKISHGQMTFSYMGVAGFFAISGYLVVQSLQRSKSLGEYFAKRALRIYPALIVVLVLTVLLGVFVYNGTAGNYISNSSVWTYIPYNLSLFKLQYSIHGVFENNPFKSTINGSLSTIPFEVIFYVFLSLLFFLNNNKQKILLIVITFCIAMSVKIFIYPYIIKYGYPSFIRRGIDYSGDFLIGALLALFKAEQIKQKNIVAIVALLFWIVSIYFHVFEWVQYFVLPVSVIMIGASSAKIINNIHNSLGDVSYGMYIYSFPVQQTLVCFFALKQMPLMILGTIVTIPFALLSWHLVEKRALRMKQYFKKALP